MDGTGTGRENRKRSEDGIAMIFLYQVSLCVVDLNYLPAMCRIICFSSQSP